MVARRVCRVPSQRRRPAIAALLLAVTGCALSTTPQQHFAKISDTVRERTGVATVWQQDGEQDAAVRQQIDALIAQPLSIESAAAIALLNNRALQSIYEDLGVARGDLLQAGLLRNPTLGLSAGFPLSHNATLGFSFSFVQEFVDLFLRPMRVQLAEYAFERTRLTVTHQALHVVWQTRQAFVAAVAAQDMVDARRTYVAAADVSARLMRLQRDAGNIGELEDAQAQAALAQVRLDLQRDEVTLLRLREDVHKLLGLSGTPASWQMQAGLPPLPAVDPDPVALEDAAVTARLTWRQHASRSGSTPARRR